MRTIGVLMPIKGLISGDRGADGSAVDIEEAYRWSVPVMRWIDVKMHILVMITMLSGVWFVVRCQSQIKVHDTRHN